MREQSGGGGERDRNLKEGRKNKQSGRTADLTFGEGTDRKNEGGGSINRKFYIVH